MNRLFLTKGNKLLFNALVVFACCCLQIFTFDQPRIYLSQDTKFLKSLHALQIIIFDRSNRKSTEFNAFRCYWEFLLCQKQNFFGQYWPFSEPIQKPIFSQVYFKRSEWNIVIKKFWNKQNDARTYLETMVNDFYANSLKWNRIESLFENHRVANFFIQPVKLQIPREVLIWGYRHQYIYRISSIWIIFSS